MTKPFPALCKDCKWSIAHDTRDWVLFCGNPKVNSKDPWALAGNGTQFGSRCNEERSKRNFFAMCGMKGKLWEPK